MFFVYFGWEEEGREFSALYVLVWEFLSTDDVCF